MSNFDLDKSSCSLTFLNNSPIAGVSWQSMLGTPALVRGGSVIERDGNVQSQQVVDHQCTTSL